MLRKPEDIKDVNLTIASTQFPSVKTSRKPSYNLFHIYQILPMFEGNEVPELPSRPNDDDDARVQCPRSGGPPMTWRPWRIRRGMHGEA